MEDASTPSETKQRLVLFDCDGTLVDSQHVIFDAMCTAFDRHGLAVPPHGQVRRVVGLSLVEAVTRLLPDAPAEDCQAVARAYKDAFITLRAQGNLAEHLFEGARASIEQLTATGYLLGIATGKSRRGLTKTLQHHALEQHFVTHQTADDHPTKPHPSMIRQALLETGVAEAATVMIGDTVFDIEMAANAGVAAIGVAWGYHDVEELRAAGASAIAEDYAELAALVERVLAGKGAWP